MPFATLASGQQRRPSLVAATAVIKECDTHYNEFLHPYTGDDASAKASAFTACLDRKGRELCEGTD